MSAFSRYVCWEHEDENRLEGVLNPDALQTSAPVFLATHHPMQLWRDSGISYDEHTFLKEFLKPRDYAFTPVLGQAGMGKSHLVRWLAANIPDTPSRKIILVRKFATNLRDIIRLILEDARGKIFDEYRTQLDQMASELMTPEYARERFLDSLALEAGRNCARGLPSKMSEELTYLVDKLPILLRDVVFRRILLQRGQVIERLTNHIIASRDEVTRVDERRQFYPDDLPGNPSDVRDFVRAGAEAQELVKYFFADPSLRIQAVDWLNASLNDAQAGLLALRGNRLSQLMLELRRQLAREGKELVLLIEDFALLQGVDLQLLEALLQRPEQGSGGRLCALRTAMACTTGYFDGLPETVRQRVDFTVTLDTPEKQPGTDDMAAFAARYLNAVRLPQGAIEAWHARVIASGATDLPVPSACDGCKHHTVCIQGFGSGGAEAPFSLYPFTKTALTRMLDRVSPEAFNPRLLKKDILKNVLDHYAGDLAAGKFPPAEMAQAFRPDKKSRLGTLEASVRFAIQQRDKINAGRREVLLDLWSDGEQLINLDESIHAAFDLPPLSSAATEPVTSEATTPRPKPESARATPVSDTLSKSLNELNLWVSGDRKLSYDLAGDLRRIVFNSIQQAFAWDTEVLLLGHYKAFKNTSVVFQRQQSLASPGDIVIRVPEEDKPELMREAGMLLRGLLQFSKGGSWNFPDAPVVQRLLGKYLDNWIAQLRRHVRELDRPERDPVPAGVQALAIGAKLFGAIPAGASDAAVAKALFAPLPTVDSSHRAPEWKKLAEEFAVVRPAIVQVVLSHLTCPKGGSGRVAILDAKQLLSPLAALRENDWRPTVRVPEVSGCSVLERFNALLGRSLDPAVAQEAARVELWLKRVTDALGDDPRLSEVVEAVKRALEAGSNAGLGSARSAKVHTAIEGLVGIDVPALLKEVAIAGQASDRIAALAGLDQHGMCKTLEFVESALVALQAGNEAIDEWFKNSSDVETRKGVELRQQMDRDIEAISAELRILAQGGPRATR